MSDYGLKISQPGYDVKTCSDNQLVFSSKFNYAVNVAVLGSASQTNNSGSSANIIFTINHGLSFTPFCLIYYKLSTSSSYWNVFPGGVYFLSGDINHGNAYHQEVDETSVKVYFYNMPDGSTVYLKYFIFNVSV